jgi:putative addiction module component (TIGR02574 family)
MNVSLAQLFDLPVSERLALIEALWDSVTAETEPASIPDWQWEELERRRKAHEANPSAAKSWEEVKARITNKHG